jgi:hypothetical protein
LLDYFAWLFCLIILLGYFAWLFCLIILLGYFAWLFCLAILLGVFKITTIHYLARPQYPVAMFECHSYNGGAVAPSCFLHGLPKRILCAYCSYVQASSLFRAKTWEGAGAI